ncbi:MAG: amidohydrolase family protein [Gemmatimonadota bacterium]
MRSRFPNVVRMLGLLAAPPALAMVPALVAFVQPVAAQDVAIVGGTVHTVAGPAIDNATVLVRDGRIAAVGPDVPVPQGVQRIEAAGKIVTPGIFDPASGIGIVEVDQVDATIDTRIADEEDPITAAFDVTYGLNPHSTLVTFNRSLGVTTAATLPSGGLISGQGAVIDLVGDTPSEMVVKSRAAMRASYDESAAEMAGGARGGAALRLREVLEDARFWAANRAAFDRGDARELAQSRLDLEALQPVLAGRMPLVVEADRAGDILAVLAITREFGIRPVIMGGAEAWMVADELARAAVPVILKPLTNAPEDFERLGSRFDNAAMLHAAGVPVAFTTFENHRAFSVLQEAGNAVRYGLPWDAGLRAVTLTPAEIYGVADGYGSIEPGKVANLVVWSDDPFEVSGRAETVVIRGEVIEPWSRQEELFERYRTLDGDRPPAYTGGAHSAGTP